MKRLPSTLLSVLKIAIGVLLIYWLVFRDDNLSRIAELVSDLHVEYLVALCVIALLSRLLSAYKWKTLLEARSAELSLYQLFKYTLIGQFFSNFLPGMIGGDITRVYFLNRQVKSVSRSVGSVFIDRFTGLAALLLLVLVLSVANYRLMLLPAVGVSVAAVFLFSFCLVAALALGDRLFAVAKPLRSIGVIERILTMIEALHAEIVSYRGHLSVLLKALLFSVVFSSLNPACLFLSGLSIQVEMTFVDIALVTPIIYLVATIPVTPSNVGWWEWCVTLFLGELGASTAESVTVALIMRLAFMALSLLGGLFFLTDRGTSWSSLRKELQLRKEQPGGS
jgi:glycosyltransferase 2 family protein